MTTKIDNNIYCCNGFCPKKDNCFRYQFMKCASTFEHSECLYLNEVKYNCFLNIKELESNKITK